MTDTKEKKSIFSTLKFKLTVFFLVVIFFFYALCFQLTSSEELTRQLESERILASKKKYTSSNSFLDSTFLKDIKTRREELKIKLQKDHAGILFLTKAELQNFLNFNQETKNWQKYAEYNTESELTMNVFYPVNEIACLKYLPFLSDRTCHLKLTFQPFIKNNHLYANLKSIKLPKWSAPVFFSNVYWQIKAEEEWKNLKKISITEFGVFLIFEQKIESGR